MAKAFFLTWIICGVAAGGFMNRVFDNTPHWGSEAECKEWAARDQSVSLMIGLAGGPLSLIVAMAMSGFGYSGWEIARHDCSAYKGRNS